jgi:hypothetical protein
MSRSATFTVTFTAARGSDAIRALRGILKLALRTLRVTRCRRPRTPQRFLAAVRRKQ